MAKVDISKLIKRAEEALQRRNYDLAIFNYLQALSLRPENIDARIKLRATQTRAASENGSSSLKMIPSYIKSMLLGMIGKHEQAMIAAENALKRNPGHVGAMKLLAKAAEKAEYEEVAAWQRQEIADKHAQEDTGNLWELVELYKQLQRPKDALKCLDKISQIDPDEDIGPEERNLSAMQTSEIYETGVEQGARSILKDEDETEKLEMDAGKLRTDEQREKVISFLLENDAKERPDDHRIFLRLGEICSDMNDWEKGYAEAKKYYEQAHSLNATDNTVLDKMGDLEIKSMRVELQGIKAKIKATPSDKQLRAVFKQKNQARVKYEIEEFERRVKAQPLKAVFHKRLGDLYFQSARYDEAIAELQQAAKDPKYKIEALTSLGRCFAKSEQLDMAITQFQRAREGQELFTKIREPMYFEAEAHEAKGDADNDVDAFNKALEIFTIIYETDIGFRDVREKVPALQKKIKAAGK